MLLFGALLTHICAVAKMFEKKPLPYGKVENAGIPSDYNGSTSINAKVIDPLFTDHSFSNGLIVATVPTRHNNQPSDPDGHSEWLLVHGATKAKVFNFPGYPRPCAKPRRSNMIELKQTPDTGMAVFATCDIKVGDLIFSERPLLVTPRAVFPPARLNLSGYSKEKVTQTIMFEYEKILEHVVSRMSPERRAALLALCNSHTEDGSGKIMGIIRTNGFSISNIGDGPNMPLGHLYPPERSYSGLSDLGSRFNHSCIPNVTISFKRSSFSFQFSASRDIKAGEECFVSYCDIFQSATDRKKELAPYGFECKCKACLHATPATDKLRIEYQDKVARLVHTHGPWVLDTTKRHFDELIEFEKEVVKEGLHSQKMYRFVVGIIGHWYEKYHLYTKAKPYLDLEERWKTMASDEE
ncbi:SET domain-containing protein 5 [Leucoagaricus sp. SymC.cos]|nr:SET domain-containing protein 5 [Leucoagaricus sp. SymC.cos]